MKDLFRNAWDCLVRYPFLCLPILLVLIINRGIHLSLHPIVHWLTHWATQTHSVLGPTVTSESIPGWLPLVLGLIKFILVYTEAILEIIGALITTCFAYHRIAGSRSDIKNKIFWSHSIGGVLAVSLLSLLLSTFISAVLFLLEVEFNKGRHYVDFLSQNLGYVQILFGGLIVAYALVPYLLRVIGRALGIGSVRKLTELQARNAALLVAVLATAITFSFNQAILKVPILEGSKFVTTYLRSVIAAFPQILLAIVFGVLLARETPASVSIPDDAEPAPTP